VIFVYETSCAAVLTRSLWKKR